MPASETTQVAGSAVLTAVGVGVGDAETDVVGRAEPTGFSTAAQEESDTEIRMAVIAAAILQCIMTFIEECLVGWFSIRLHVLQTGNPGVQKCVNRYWACRNLRKLVRRLSF